MLPDRIPFTSNATVAWLPDESGFAVNAGTAPDFERVDKVLLVHRLGQAEPVAARADRGARAVLRLPAGLRGRTVARGDHERGRASRRLDPARSRTATGGRSCSTSQARATASSTATSYVAVCTEEAPRGRLVRIPIATAADRQTWSELIPESDLVLRFVQRAGDLLVVGALREACSVVIVLWPDGRSRGDRAPGRRARLALGVPQRCPAGGRERGHGRRRRRGRVLVRARRARPLRRPVPVRARLRAGSSSCRPPEARLPVRRHALRGDGTRWRDGRLRGRPPRGSRALGPAGRPLRLRRLERRARARLARRECPSRRGGRRARALATSAAAARRGRTSTGTERSSGSSTPTTTSTRSRRTSPRGGSPIRPASPCSAARTAA